MTRRVLYLVRHGQYETELGNAGSLTALGVLQARRTGQWLAKLNLQFDKAYVSTLPRARETAACIGESTGTAFTESPLLCEGFPTRVEGHTTGPVTRDRARFEQAFRRFFSPEPEPSFELLVCHGNIIRFFVCRALHVPVKNWIMLGTNHAAVTRIVVKSDGTSGVASFNETTHLPQRLLT